MPVRQGPIDLAAEDLRSLATALGTELRETRIGMGLSQRAVARSAGVSASRLGRIERRTVPNPSLDVICRAARVLGLSVSVRLFPAGSPVRDAGQLAVIGRFEPLLGPGLGLRREVVLPIPGDLRAWDGVVTAQDGVAFMDAESRLGDIQALERRLAIKLRDDPRGSILILVVARTFHNRTVMLDHRETLRPLLPLDGAAIARAIRAGRLPPASGIIVL